VETRGEDGSIGDLLECFMYLKLYAVWGTQLCKELKSQEELWEHLQTLWKGADHLETLTVKQAVGTLKTEITNRLIGKGENVVEALVFGELLIPQEDFLSSLREGEDKNEVLPSTLVTLWSDLITLIDRDVGVLTLIEELIVRLRKEGVGSKLTAAWVNIFVGNLLEEEVGKRKISLKKASLSGVRLEKWLSEPSPSFPHLAPILCKLAGLTTEKSEKVVQLVIAASVSASSGDQSTKKLKNWKPHQVEELAGMESQIDNYEVKGKEVDTGWIQVVGETFESVKFVRSDEESWRNLWVEGEWEGECLEVDKWEKIPVFEVGPVDWGAKKEYRQKVNPDKARTPHFYSNNPQRKRFKY